jgi:uncharacterized protein (TIGR02453 family)
MDFPGFDKSLVKFLGQLERNNNRDWFKQNKDLYEAQVRGQALAFIRAMAPRIERISGHILVSDSKAGGSMMRPYRDTRFSSSKQPYKTNVGIHFRHGEGEDAHAPGFWMHIEPGEFWLAVGMWRPSPEALLKVRRQMVARPQEWLAVRDEPGFRAKWQVVGNALKRAPRGFDPHHPLIEDIRRTEFLGYREMGMKELYRRDVVDRVAVCYDASRPFMQFLCGALMLRF